jgi:hypothetical protein
MEISQNKIISISMGDTASIPVKVFGCVKDGETAILGVYTFDDWFDDSFIVVKKEVDSDEDGKPMFEFTPEMTMGKAGRYRYQVKVQNLEGEWRTIQPETRFNILR